MDTFFRGKALDKFESIWVFDDDLLLFGRLTKSIDDEFHLLDVVFARKENFEAHELSKSAT